MRRALSALGVGSVELSQASVFDSADAADLERLLAAMLEPQREPLLRAALATEAMGCDAAALQALADDEAALLDCIGRFAALPRHLADARRRPHAARMDARRRRQPAACCSGPTASAG